METLVEQIIAQEVFVRDVRKEEEEEEIVKLPIWLTEDLIEDALKNFFKDNGIKVRNLLSIFLQISFFYPTR
jgi:hypothetical protein